MNIQKTLLGSLAVIIFYNLLLFGTGLGIGTGLFFLLVHLFLYYTRDKEASSMHAYVVSGVSILFALLTGYQSNPEVQLLNLAAVAGASIYAAYLYRIDWKEQITVPKLITIPISVGINSIVAGLKLLFVRESTQNESTIPLGPILRGIVITIPVFIVLLILLVNADPVFSNFTEKILSQSLERVILSLILFGVLVSVGLSSYRKKAGHEFGPARNERAYELSVLVSSLVILFGMFIFIQFRYLFSAVSERELGKLGIASLTYSEYVRRGFFELLITSTIAGGVITTVHYFLYRLEPLHKSIMQSLTGIMTIQTGMLLYSAFFRLVLYADSHGLTRARIWGFIFLLWLGGSLVLLLLRSIKEISQEKIAYGLLSLTMAVLLITNGYSMDRVIATNYPPTVNGEIDYSYIALLSPDAHPIWTNMLRSIETDVTRLEELKEFTNDDYRKLYLDELTLDRTERTIDILMVKYASDKEMETWFGEEVVLKLKDPVNAGQYKWLLPHRHKWQEFNSSEYQGYRVVSAELARYSAVKQLISRIGILKDKLNLTINPPIDRPINPPVLR